MSRTGFFTARGDSKDVPPSCSIIRPLLITAIALASSPAALAAPAKPERIYKPAALADLQALVPVLRTHVAHLEVEVAPSSDDPLRETERDGYAVVLDPHRLAVLSFTVENAKRIMISGPGDKRIPGLVVLSDVERRVAIIESKIALSQAGLVPAPIAPLASRRIEDDVFALVFSGQEATVMHGVFVYVGDDPEYGGHHRVDLKLARGMPVFDSRARFVGYARAVAWDKDPLMIVTPEMIQAARTATGAAARDSASPKKSARPWWSK